MTPRSAAASVSHCSSCCDCLIDQPNLFARAALPHGQVKQDLRNRPSLDALLGRRREKIPLLLALVAPASSVPAILPSAGPRWVNDGAADETAVDDRYGVLFVFCLSEIRCSRRR
jgi:hypothetical protein